MRNDRVRYLQENGKTFYVSPKGTKYLEVGNKRHRGPLTTNPILELLDYPKPPTLHEIFNFADKEAMLKWLAQEAANLTNRPITDTQAYVLKGNALLKELAKEWMSSRDIAVYQNPDYLFETICCSLYVTGEFKKDGRLGKNSGIDNMMRTLHMLGYDKKAARILDMGSGLGFTTLYAAYFCPHATVYYNDTSPPSRLLFQKLVARSGLTNIVILDDWREPPEELDVVMGFEFVEHISSEDDPLVGDPILPIRHVHPHIKLGGHFLYSTMWNAEQNNGETIGHFTSYRFGDTVVNLDVGKSDRRSRAPHKLFTEQMKKLGYKIRNGGGARTEWDWKNHYPYCYTKVSA